MGITNSNKKIDVTQIDCKGTLKVTLALSASPDISSNPTDIILILDRSGSMTGIPLENMKTGAKTFVSIIEEATDGTQDGTIGSGSHIGIVSFSDTAIVDTPLTTSVASLDAAIDSLSASGTTNHADAFSKAIQSFDPTSTNAKVIVMFTDGKTTSGLPPAPIAAAARASGITIYCIGLIGSDGIDINVLNDWATDPDNSHVAVTPNASDLEDLFANLAANISKPGATNIVINEMVNPDFHIISVIPPNIGSAIMVNATTLQWNIPKLGVTANEGAALEFYIQHVGQSTGTKLVNDSIIYSDSEGNMVTFPTPSVRVDCGLTVIPEPCPVPVDLSIGGCQDFITVNLGDTYLNSQGRILELNVTLKNVCPDKRVALGVILTEVDSCGNEYQRGLKTMTIPAHHYTNCQDVFVKCITFVLPEDLTISCNQQKSICGKRNFKARIIAHTIDTDYRCCESIVTMNE